MAVNVSTPKAFRLSERQEKIGKINPQNQKNGNLWAK